MKFTNEQAVEALRAELTNKGRKTLHMSERTLARQAELLVKKLANDETGLPEFVADAIEILNEFEGDARKKNSDFAKYKEAHPDTVQEPVEPKPQEKNENPEMRALMERIAALEKDKQEAEKRTSIEQKKKDLSALIREKGVDDDKWIDLQLSKVNLDREIIMEDEANDYLKLYNATRAHGGQTDPPKNPKGGSSDNAQIKSVVAAAAALAKSNKDGRVI